MKKSLILFTCLVITNFVFSQWTGNTTTTGDITRTGNVGIGLITTPEAKLHIVKSGGQGNAPIIGGNIATFQHNDGSGYNASINVLSGTLGTSSLFLGDVHSSTMGGVRYDNNNNSLSFRTNQQDNKMIISSSGNVGIGTATTNEKLTVKGKILCSEVEVVDINSIPDYVFQKYYTGTSILKEDYMMPTLEEIETFTKANHHLPEVPSAADIKENGMQLKDMTITLLQKIEELTLYTIEQEKRIKALEIQLNKKQ